MTSRAPQVRRIPTAAEQERAQAAEDRRTIVGGIVGGLLIIAMLMLILAAGATPVRAASGDGRANAEAGCRYGHSVVLWSVHNPNDAGVLRAVLTIDTHQHTHAIVAAHRTRLLAFTYSGVHEIAIRFAGTTDYLFRGFVYAYPCSR